MIKAWAASEAGGRLEPFEYEPGPLGHDEVEIEVLHCGICHRDLNMLDNDWGMTHATMLEFTARHGIKPVIETFRFDQVNEALDRLRSGKTRYRIVLSK